MKTTKIVVPASLANIGPGFDVLGIGLELNLEIVVKIDPKIDTSSDPNQVKIEYSGEGAAGVPIDSNKNLLTQTALYVMRCNGMDKFAPGTVVSVKNPIPLGRGLGLLGAAIVGGAILGNVVGEFNFLKERLLDYCLLIERHPDNIAAAMLGGFVGLYLKELNEEETAAKSVPLEYILPKSTTNPSQVVRTPPPQNIAEYVNYPWSKQIKCLTVIPQFELSTEKARSALPESYGRADIVYNLQRLAVLTTALGHQDVRHELIYESMKDKIHQPYRAALIPGLTQVLTQILPQSHKGVCGICLLGAGPTVLCLVTENHEDIARDIVEIFAKEGVKCTWQLLDLAYEGAVVKQIE